MEHGADTIVLPHVIGVLSEGLKSYFTLQRALNELNCDNSRVI